jgi:putative FmdB family regulatory protein
VGSAKAEVGSKEIAAYSANYFPLPRSDFNLTTMPTYEYHCDACGFDFEKFQSMSSSPIKKCPNCGKNKVRRLIGTGAGLIFKGSGFYITDYRDKSYADKAKAESTGGETKPAETKTAEAKSPETKTPAAETKPSTGEKATSSASKASTAVKSSKKERRK